MRKREVFIAFCVLICILISQDAMSIGISRLQPMPQYIIAKPLESHTFSFVQKGYGSDTKSYVDADEDLLPYVTLSEDEIIAPYEKKFSATISFPANITAKPGLRRIAIGAEELAAPGTGITTKTKAEYRFKVYILYSYKYIEAEFNTQNVNLNEIADFNVHVKNFGVPDIRVLMATVDIYNSKNEKVTQIISNFSSLPSGQETDIDMKLNTTGMAAGEYNATATVYYDGDEIIINKDFKIGEMKIEVTNYTDTLFVDEINRMEIEVDNKFNGVINDIYADIEITTQNGTVSAKTTSERIDSLSKGILTGHVDLKDVLPGVYPIEIKVYYENEKSVERGMVNVIKPGLLDRPKDISMIIGISVVIILIILTIINTIMLFKRRKKD